MYWIVIFILAIFVVASLAWAITRAMAEKRLGASEAGRNDAASAAGRNTKSGGRQLEIPSPDHTYKQTVSNMSRPELKQEHERLRRILEDEFQQVV